MTAREKELVLKSWKTFLKHGMKRQHLTKRLFEYLRLHCRPRSCCDIHDFYSVYFKAGQDIHQSFKDFTYSCNTRRSTCADLNKAMLKVYYQYKDKITAQINNDIAEKLNMLDEGLLKAKQNPASARQFLRWLNFRKIKDDC